jgi:hypothetical protein
MLIPVIFAMSLIFIPAVANAATIDEIITMNNSGVSGELIVEVLDATGIDDPIDLDTLEYLESIDIDPYVLGYLRAIYNNNVDEVEEYVLDGDYDKSGTHWNYAGGDGFSHGGTTYNPNSDNNYKYNYDRSRRNDSWGIDDYLRNYNGNTSVYIYEPPVYYMYSNPYGAYRSPRYYYNNGYCGTSYYSPYYYSGGSRYYYDNGYYGGFGGRSHHYNRNYNYGSFGSFFFSDDDWGIRLSF